MGNWDFYNLYPFFFRFLCCLFSWLSFQPSILGLTRIYIFPTFTDFFPGLNSVWRGVTTESTGFHRSTVFFFTEFLRVLRVFISREKSRPHYFPLGRIGKTRPLEADAWLLLLALFLFRFIFCCLVFFLLLFRGSSFAAHFLVGGLSVPFPPFLLGALFVYFCGHVIVFEDFCLFMVFNFRNESLFVSGAFDFVVDRSSWVSLFFSALLNI